MNKSKKIIYSSVLLSLVIFFILGCGEILTRIFALSTDSLPIDFVASPTLNFKMKPLSKGTSIMGIRYSINSHGLRDFEYDYRKDKNVYRILVLGSSLTFGYGVNMEDTFCKRLEGLLNSNNSDSRKQYQVINTGVTGYNTIQQLRFLKEEGLKYQPDMVMVFFVSSNVGLKPAFGRVEDGILLESHSLKIPLFLKRIMRKSSLYHFLAYNYRLIRFKKKKTPVNNVELDNEFFKKWKQYKKFPLEVIQLCKKKDIKLLYTFFPRPEEIYQDAVLSKKYLFNLLDEEAVTCLDLTASFRRKDFKNLFLAKDVCHPNKEGHALIAAQIYDFLSKKQ